MIKAIEIFKSYDSLRVLNGINLEVKRGEVVAIVGASGAGKSTLLHILGTLDKPDGGQLLINNNPIPTTSNSLATFRNKAIGFVFQFHNLLPEFTALENVMIPGLIAGKSNGELRETARDMLSMLGVSQREGHKPSELSGGEQQRIAVG